MTKACMHFVGFKDERVFGAVRVFGQPDFWHRTWDNRAKSMIFPDEGDFVVFADVDEDAETKKIAFDDSQMQ